MNTYSSFRFLFIFFIVCITNEIYSQSNFTHGIGMGLNSSSFDNVEINRPSQPFMLNFNRIAGFSFFTRTNYKLNQRFKLSSGFGFSFKGAKDIQSKFHSISFDVPLIGQARVFKQLFFAAGVQYEYLLNMSVMNEQFSDNINDFIDRRNFLSLHVGLNYNLMDWVEIGLAYKPNLQRFLTTTFIGAKGGYIEEFSLKQNNLQFSIIVSH